MVRRSVLVAAVLAAGALLVPSASAEPATTVGYPAGATATRYVGPAFDTCTAPTVAALTAWRASPYRAVAVYVGGVNRTCAQPQLTASWVSAVSRAGWRLLPVYKGLQPWCGARPRDQKITAAGATSQGTAAAADAVAHGTALGMLPGTGYFLDVENYATTDVACRAAVLRFVSGWTKELHRRGDVAGVYANLASGAKDLSAAYTSTAYARPDVLWVARWDGNPALMGWAGIPDSQWAVYQRAKQFRGDHAESYGGVTLTIDSDRVAAPVASLAFAYRVTSSTALNARTGPSTGSSVVHRYPPGATVRLVCQTTGSKVGTTVVWDKLTDGSYVTDYYVSTTSKTTYSAPLARCAYPAQVTAPDGLSERTGPGAGYPAVGTLPGGALAWVVCQRAGSRVGTTSVWDRLDDGRWVSDHYVATRSATSFSAPVPRC
ncbi:MAG: glycoside hydrolase domain-containing protein [Mycobacteriales bacterium]